ncbi:olfactory receptor 5G9-like [Pleurodeles waltl]|uniref:olfactory receptor 5G9-like n=1 Tax=Pleurodeles waltl TaxID=8319 RepID=UPI003709ADC0
MKPGNRSTVTEFILLGLTHDPKLKVFLFLILVAIYILTLVGNITILLIVYYSTQLQTPMYLFLTQLSFLDIILSTVFSPKTLVDLFSEKKTISFYGCLVQLYFLGACTGTESFLLAVMAFDRYVAICNPLLYNVTMTKGPCVCLVVGSYISGFLHSLIHAAAVLWLSFCGPNVIDNFACDYPVLMKLSCIDFSFNELLRFVLVGFVVAIPLFIIFVSYFKIIIAILRIRTTAGRRRAASTCISHFTCVFLFYGSAFYLEVLPNKSSSQQQYKALFLILTEFIPALNPLIYSLRNKEMQQALRKTVPSISHT